MSDPYTEGLKLLGLPVNVEESVRGAPMTEEFSRKIVEVMKMGPEEYERHSIENPQCGIAVPPELAHQEMTLRDHFAGLAMTSLVMAWDPNSTADIAGMALASYVMADEMLRARKR